VDRVAPGAATVALILIPNERHASNIVERAISPKQLRERTVYSPPATLARHTAHLMMSTKRDFEPDPEISGPVIAWHRLRGARRRAEGRKVGRSNTTPWATL